jgi:hypothetical protein
MFKRLSGESTTRFRKDRFYTGGDLKTGNLGQLAQEQLTHPRFFSSGLQHTMALDEHGFLWHHPPKASIATTVQQQRYQDMRDVAQKHKQPTAEAKHDAHRENLFCFYSHFIHAVVRVIIS